MERRTHFKGMWFDFFGFFNFF